MQQKVHNKKPHVNFNLLIAKVCEQNFYYIFILTSRFPYWGAGVAIYSRLLSKVIELGKWNCRL